MGLVIAVGLLSSVPLYADAVQSKLLQGELTEVGTVSPPFALLWHYAGCGVVQIAWEQVGTILATYGVMFIIAVLLMACLLIRMRVFRIVKTGRNCAMRCFMPRSCYVSKPGPFERIASNLVDLHGISTSLWYYTREGDCR